MAPMKLVWSQHGSAPDRPRQILLLAIVCVFLGGLVGGRSDSPRPFRAAAASLFERRNAGESTKCGAVREPTRGRSPWLARQGPLLQFFRAGLPRVRYTPLFGGGLESAERSALRAVRNGGRPLGGKPHRGGTHPRLA